jgi:hypothetical protein
MHRTRLALPYLPTLGWTPTVLCVDPQYVPSPQDPLLNESFPQDTRVIRVNAIPLSISRKIGLGSLAIRAWSTLHDAGLSLLRKERFDLVYFSTTEFGTFPLGPKWKKLTGTPYVLDYQDPWITDYYYRNRIKPPGGHLKYMLSQLYAKWQEQSCIKQASGITAVSHSYIKQLTKTYHFPSEKSFTIPFGGAEKDFQIAKQCKISHGAFDPNDGFKHWVYTGVAGPYMTKALTSFFRAFRVAATTMPEKLDRVKLHFIGTDYAPPDKAKLQVTSIAMSEGVSQWVHEIPTRLPYFSALKCLLDADALIVPGSEDPAYTASKIFPYILAEKPLLTIFHRESSVNSIVKTCNAGTVLTFDESTTVDDISRELIEKWFRNCRFDSAPLTFGEHFNDFTSQTMTIKLTEAFAASLHN